MGDPPLVDTNGVEYVRFHFEEPLDEPVNDEVRKHVQAVILEDKRVSHCPKQLLG